MTVRVSPESTAANIRAWLDVANIRAADSAGIAVPDEMRRAAVERYLAAPIATPEDDEEPDEIHYASCDPEHCECALGKP